MTYKKLIMGIFLVVIILMSSNMVFAEDISYDSSSQDNTIAISDNNNIATVNNAGKIKAKASGVCKIYVIAANGVRATLKVSVH